MKITIVGELVIQALSEYGNEMPSKTIARLLYDKHPKVFTSVEHARDKVRSYRGNKGLKDQSNVSNKSFFRKPGNTNDGNIPLPVPIEAEKPWEIMQLDFKKALVLSDVHIPYHHAQSLKLALETGDKHNVDCVILNGDIVDFYAISSFDKNPESRNLNREVQQTRLFLEHLRGRYPKAQIVYKEGNHEERLWRYAWHQCPELYTLMGPDGRRMLTLESLLDTDEYGITVVKDKKPIRCGRHLHILHGHEFRSPFQNPVNPARGLYLRAKCNAICGDLHQSSNHTENGLTSTMSCWSLGALCDLRPAYMPLNKWNHGFGIIELNRDQWSFENKKIISGTVVSA